MKKFTCIALLLSICLLAGLGERACAESGGEVFLTVGEILFGTVGESEGIYAGSAPLEKVVWKSDDPQIIAVENGVLTAVGVGTTRIYATFEDSTVFCDAACLARDQAELMNLPLSQLCRPTHIVPEVSSDVEAFFSDAVFIGDSGSYNMMVYENQTNLLGHPLILARKNVGAFNLYHDKIRLSYRGNELSAEDAVAASGRKKVFLLLGTNDLGYQTPEEASQRYAAVLQRILQKTPDAQIYIQTCPPFYFSSPYPSSFNSNMDLFNQRMREIARENGYHIVDVAAYVKDLRNNMAYDYCMDFAAHLNEAGCIVWMKVLRAYAHTQLLAA